jgi:CofD-related protein of GAK system
MDTQASKAEFCIEETVSQHSQITEPTLPEFGPRLTFFTGGSAMKQTSRALKQWTHRSQHIVSPFDSGGSSAQLRKAFNMPAIGDLRSRLLALADESYEGQPDAYQLLNYRLPKQAKATQLQQELDAMIAGQHPLVRALPPHWQTPICHDLFVFNRQKPTTFDLQGASIGNLVLAGSYLEHKGSIGEVLTHFKSMVHLLGDVELSSHEVMDLVARLEDGSEVVGQHRITGKEHAPLSQKIERIYLAKAGALSHCSASSEALEAIRNSELICYAPGSFYSSLIASLLPEGIADEIAQVNCPKVYVPSLGYDPEAPKLSVYDRVIVLMGYLSPSPSSSHLNGIVFDPQLTQFSPEQKAHLQRLGIRLIEKDLITAPRVQSYDPIKLAKALVEMV